MTGYMRQRQAAAFCGISLRTFRRVCPVPPKLLPSSLDGGRPLLVWRAAELEEWVEAINNPKSRKYSKTASVS